MNGRLIFILGYRKSALLHTKCNGPSQFNAFELVGELTSCASSTAYPPPSPPNVGLRAGSGEEATAGATEGDDWSDSPVPMPLLTLPVGNTMLKKTTTWSVPKPLNSRR